MQLSPLRNGAHEPAQTSLLGIRQLVVLDHRVQGVAQGQPGRKLSPSAVAADGAVPINPRTRKSHAQGRAKNDKSGLDSALAFSRPEALGHPATKEDDGYLQAWEILEQLKLNADLVVLSTCELGLSNVDLRQGFHRLHYKPY